MTVNNLHEKLKEKGLSNREIEVTEAIAKGLSNKEVGNMLFLTDKTIKFHYTNVLKKMSLKSRAELVVWCIKGEIRD